MRNTFVILALLLASGLAWWLLNDSSSTPNDTDTSIELADGNADQAPELKGTGTKSRLPDEKSGAEGTYSITGTVMNEQERPLPGVSVELVQASGSITGQGYQANQRSDAMRTTRLVSAIRSGTYRNEAYVATAVSDERGRFKFRVAEAAQYTVYARVDAPRAGGSATAYLSPKSRTSTNVHVVVFDGTPLLGRVEDAQGRPVAAGVYAYTRSWRGEVRSDAETGAFRFEAVPKHELSFTVSTSSDRRFSGIKVPYPFESPLVLKLPSGSGEIAGFVHTHDGGGVSGADAYLSLSLESDSKPKKRLILAVTSDADGRFVVGNVPSGEITTARVAAEGFLVQSLYKGREGFEAVSIGPDKTSSLDITLSRGSSVYGKVTRKEDGAPIEGALVSLYGGGWNQSHAVAATTNAEGLYKMDRLGPGKFVVLASHRDFFAPEVEAAFAQPYRVGQGQRPRHLTVELQSKETSLERNLTLVRGFSLSGTVIGPKGEPMGGAEIHAKNGSLSGRLSFAWNLQVSSESPPLATSASDGAFSIPGLAPRADWVLYGRKVGYAGSYSDAVSLGSGPVKGVIVRLMEQCVVRGTVVDAEGNALPNAKIFVGGQSSLRGGPHNFKSNEEGAFELSSLPAASLRLSANHKGESVVVPVTGLKPGDVREGVIIAFGNSVEIHGTVRDSQRNPVANLTLLCQRRDGQAIQHMNGLTNAQGEFTFKNLKPGSGTMYVRISGGLAQALGKPFTIPATDLEFTFDPPEEVTIRGTIVGPDGAPVPVCDIHVTAKGEHSFKPSTVKGGIILVTLKGDPPYRVQISNPRTTTGERLNIQGSHASVTDVSKPLSIILKAGARLSGRVVDPKGKGVLGAVVKAGSNSATTNVDGTWTIYGIAPERTVIVVTPPSTFVAPDSIVVEPNTIDIIVKVLHGTFIKGRVVPPQGTVIGFGNVVATWSRSGTRSVGHASGQIDTGGLFTIAGIAPDALVTLKARVYGIGGGTPSLPPATVAGIKAGATDVKIHFVTGLSAQGVVVDKVGQPVAGLQISFRGTGKHEDIWQGGLTNEEGHFEIQGLAPGVYIVSYYQDQGYVTLAHDVRVPAETLKFKQPESGTISGTLKGVPRDSSWSVIAFESVSGTSSPKSRGIVSPAGTWTVEVPDMSRKWVIAARNARGTDDLFARSAPVASGTADIELKLEQGLSIEGRTESGGRPLPKCSIHVKSSSWTSSVQTDMDGTFRVRGLPPGTYSLSAKNWASRVMGTREGVAAGSTGVVVDMNEPIR